jgi:hypothetical protein
MFSPKGFRGFIRFAPPSWILDLSTQWCLKETSRTNKMHTEKQNRLGQQNSKFLLQTIENVDWNDLNI